MLFMIMIIFAFIFAPLLRTHIFRTARLALSAATRVWYSRKQMSVNTMGLASIYSCRPFAAQDIFFRRNQSKMLWVYASPIFTDMVNFWTILIYPFWDKAKSLLIKPAVGFYSFALPIYSTISITERALPNPALSFWVYNKVRHYTSKIFIKSHVYYYTAPVLDKRVL